ncbi:SufE family protein [Sneathiella chinensis]|uniref:Fe-S metabolism protein SufE n=1 Tax=Sneathiella chinensis TaxID=349750 RepID=A0ABQ5U1N5_9PROT|nr:SufE family protein [Sneathiella chinensis]GLQ06092.1 Fe-S metabolism protein SufE [Sneathiella chinensis]
MSAPEKSIEETIQDFKDAFLFLEEWTDRYGYLIDLGRKLPDFPEAAKVDENLMEGCQSQVWLLSHMEGDRLRFQAASDALIVSGLIGLLLAVYDNRTPAEILDTDPAFLQELGLNQHLSPSRSNGLYSFVKHINAAASRAS